MEGDFLPLSGIQHFAFCRRQWALIHVEQQWAENARTVDGDLFHRRAHDAQQFEARGDLLIARGLRIASRKLGLSGVCDVVEFRRDPAGITLAGREGSWRAHPVEYKRGAPKENEADALQLCAQAMCLEEMLCCEVPDGALFYGEPRRRLAVSFTPELREEVRMSAVQMHDLYRRGYTPRVKPTKACNACSLRELCLPRLQKSGSVQVYLQRSMEETP